VHGVSEKETYEALSTAVNDWTLGYMYIERNEKEWKDEGVNMNQWLEFKMFLMCNDVTIAKRECVDT
jgi:hypothetical protein